MAQMGVVERQGLREEVSRLREQVVRWEQEKGRLSAMLGPLRAEAAALGGERAQVASLHAEVQQLQQKREALTAELSDLERLTIEVPRLRAEYAELSRDLIETREAVILQEAGIYEYRHPLRDAVAYKVRLAGLQAQIKDAVKAGTAVQGAANWTVNGSAREGAKMVREFSRLMLRAYNNEADNAVRSMKPYTLESSVARLQKAQETISRLGGTMHIRITDRYHGLRVEELGLTADYLAKLAEEKEREREERARLREEEIARREYEREQERLPTGRLNFKVCAIRQAGQGPAGPTLLCRCGRMGVRLLVPR
jgi:myosin heavy subunit